MQGAVTAVVLGLGPVGLMAVVSACQLGAQQVLLQLCAANICCLLMGSVSGCAGGVAEPPNIWSPCLDASASGLCHQ